QHRVQADQPRLGEASEAETPGSKSIFVGVSDHKPAQAKEKIDRQERVGKWTEQPGRVPVADGDCGNAAQSVEQRKTRCRANRGSRATHGCRDLLHQATYVAE